LAALSPMDYAEKYPVILARDSHLSLLKLPNVEVGTLVLIKDDHVATTKWTMGRIVQAQVPTDW